MTDQRQKFLDTADSLREKADKDDTTAADAAGFAQASLIACLSRVTQEQAKRNAR
jgi:hypothetical protein